MSQRPGFLRHAATVAWKDLRVELRTREILYTTIFFAAMIVLICSFAFVDKVESIEDLSAGILWISVALSGMLGLGRAFDREREGNTMRALLLSPAPRGAIFLGKAIGVAVFMLLTVCVVVPMTVLLFGAPVAENAHLLALLLVLVIVGFATVGSVFAAMLLRARSKEVLLAVVLYPILMPLLMAGTKGTAAAWGTEATLPEALFWIKFLAVADGMFLIASLWAFESLVVE
jgi:heme exporter protein CcmB